MKLDLYVTCFSTSEGYITLVLSLLQLNDLAFDLIATIYKEYISDKPSIGVVDGSLGLFLHPGQVIDIEGFL